MEATLAEIVSKAEQDTKRRIREESEGMPERIRPMLLHIADRIFDDDFDASALRRELKPTRNDLYAFKESTGQTLRPYIKNQRMMTAKRLLETTNLEVRIVASLVRAVTVQGFSSTFKKWEGRTPEEVRQAVQPEPFRRELDWVQCYLWFGMGRLTVEQSEMMRGIEQSRAIHEPAAERLAAVLEGRLDRTGLAAARLSCRRMKAYSPALFEALCQRSRSEGRKNRQRGVELAGLALAVAEGSFERWGRKGPDYLALGWSRFGNARRLASDFHGAEQAIRKAETWAREAEVGDQTRAEILCLKGSLRLYQRRIREALEMLNEGIALSQAVGARLLLVDALFQRASIQLYLGRHSEALPDLNQARLLVPSTDTRRQLVAMFSLLDAAVLSGDDERARKLMPEAQRLSAESGDRASSFQIQWLEGLLLRKSGDLEAAEPRLRRARAGFIDLEDLGMTAVVSLELSLLCEEQGDRLSEVMSYASDALPALEALRLPEAYEALHLLRQAISERQLHRSTLDAVRRRLLSPLMQCS